MVTTQVLKQFTKGEVKEVLDKGWLKEFITTNSNFIDQKYLDLPGFKVVDVSKNVAEVVELLVTGGSTSPLFQDI